MPKLYCQHPKCRTASAADLARIGLRLFRADILQMASEAALDDTIEVRCRWPDEDLLPERLADLEFPPRPLENCS